MMYLTYYTVHIPLQAKDSLVRKYQKKAELNPDTRQNNPVYAAMVENLDLNIGRLMQALQDKNLKENTLIFFTSDNGGLSVKEGPHTPATVNYPLKKGKGYLYEGGIRVPLIVNWPAQVKPGQIIDQPVVSIDYLPTIMEVVGLKAPENVDGESILPLLTSSGDFATRDLFWHYPHYSNQGGKPGAVIRSGDYKLITFFEDGQQELYNLKEDISETRNLATEQPELVKELGQRLFLWQQRMDAQFPVPNPDYQKEAL
jgi:arylsulfatase A-like enzyme